MLLAFGAKERDSLLNIVIRMGLEGRKYDPKLSRSAVPPEITNELAKHGVIMDADSAKMAKQATAFLNEKLSPCDWPRLKCAQMVLMGVA